MSITNRTIRRSLLSLLVLGGVALAGGCAQSSSCGWAQNAPLIEAGGRELAIPEARTQAGPVPTGERPIEMDTPAAID